MNTKLLSYKNGQIAYDVTGEGPLVVCVPSLGDVRGEYRFLVPELVKAGYRVATMDVRGHGETSAEWDDFSVAGIGEDILALVRELKAGPAIVIGTSMGGGAAIWSAVEVPELVRGMILVDPFVDGDSNGPLIFLLSIMFARPWGASMWTKYYSSLYPTRKPADFDSYVSALRENIKQRGRLEAVMAMLRASKRSSGERMPKVKQPALVLMGSKDPDFKNPVAEAKRVAEAVRGEYKVIENAGHYPHAEMPEATAPLMIEFMNSLKG
ncbi:Putative non-heme bromoperoxidase BpoC [Anaerolineales bacterium]|nr:Putative non-heme bromoperoxidase BpoC [Anaerolineales bacterium]